ncbi:MAG: transposase [Labilithrix sp.]|nr:transposase [Labilithrix sp.]
MPDATVAELASVLMKRSRTSTSRSAVQRALFRLGFSGKKRRSSPSSATRSSIANAEKEFCALLKNADLSSLVFIDESFVKTGMRREYGRSLRGRRVTATRPFRSWKTISLIGAIRLAEKPKIMTSKTAVDGPKLLRFVKQRLGPWIYPGDMGRGGVLQAAEERVPVRASPARELRGNRDRPRPVSGDRRPVARPARSRTSGAERALQDVDIRQLAILRIVTMPNALRNPDQQTGRDGARGARRASSEQRAARLADPRTRAGEATRRGDWMKYAQRSDR